MQNFQIGEYRAEVKQLQTATSQWYLSILNDQDCSSDLADTCTVHPATEDGLKKRFSDNNFILGSQVFYQALPTVGCTPIGRAWLGAAE